MIINTELIYKKEIKNIISASTVIVDVETNGLDAFGQNQICGVGVAPLGSEELYYFPERHQLANNLPSE